MAEIALIAGLAAGAGTIYSGFSKQKEGEDANRISLYNAEVTRQEGEAAQSAAEFQAKQLERAATEERMGGQISAREKRDQMERVLSTQRARAAAGGAGGMETPGVLDIMGDTVERGEYLAGLETMSAEMKARGRLNQAAAARVSG